MDSTKAESLHISRINTAISKNDISSEIVWQNIITGKIKLAPSEGTEDTADEGELEHSSVDADVAERLGISDIRTATRKVPSLWITVLHLNNYDIVTNRLI